MPWMFKSLSSKCQNIVTSPTYTKLNHHFLFFLLTICSMLNESCLALLCSGELNKCIIKF